MSSGATYKGESVEFSELAGDHWLSGVDFVEWEHPDGVAQTCIFVLNGVRYVAKEDANDGYRSSLGYLIREPGSVKNTFKPCRVRGVVIDDQSTSVIKFQDANTGLDVLEIGTHNTDDYYPSFVADFQPKHMSAFVDEAPAEKRRRKQRKKDEIKPVSYPEWGKFS